MNDAILNGESFSKNQIHNEEPNENKSLPGRGICSYLGKPKIDFNSHNKWPKGNPVRFISKDLSMQGMKPHGVS